MLARIKHIILLLCMLVSVNQSIHILSHVFSSHEDSQSELVHINDHKCQLCHIDVNSLLPETEFESFQWLEKNQFQTNFFYISKQIFSVSKQYFSLRAPPALI